MISYGGFVVVCAFGIRKLKCKSKKINIKNKENLVKKLKKSQKYSIFAIFC